MLEDVIRDAADVNDIPVGQICTKPIRYAVSSDKSGCFRLVFTLHTRHYLTSVPLNERVSHRHDQTWLVVSQARNKVIGVISQNDTSYQHPDIFLTMPLDSDLVLVPSSPYIVNGSPAVSGKTYLTNYRERTYRYEILVGASADSGFIGDRWSYREGRLCFNNWFHNKAFRWAFDGAELILPTVPNAPCSILFDAHATTDFEVLVNDQVVASFDRSRDGVRWHNEDRRIDLPADLVTSDRTTLGFRFIGHAWGNIDFNLRQEGLALSRVIVDTFDTGAADLPRIIANLTWGSEAQSADQFYSFQSQILANRLHDDVTSQVLLAIAPIEFDLITQHFSPHDQFWLSVYGIWSSLLRLGISTTIRPLDSLSANGESVVIGPLRFFPALASSAQLDLSSTRIGLMLSHDIANLLLASLPVDDDALGTFAYRELFDAQISPERRSNFWEIVIKDRTYWESRDISIHENVLIGVPRGTNYLLLASASAEDWAETGDPDSRLILDLFCKFVSGRSPALAGDLPCALAFKGDGILTAVSDPRHFTDSGGSGIARGWPAFRGPSAELPEISAPVTVLDRPSHGSSEFSRMVSAQKDKLERSSMRIRGGIVTDRIIVS